MNSLFYHHSLSLTLSHSLSLIRPFSTFLSFIVKVSHSISISSSSATYFQPFQTYASVPTEYVCILFNSFSGQSVNMIVFNKKMGHPLFCFIFGLFKETLQYLQQINVKNVHPVYGAESQTHDLWNMSLLPEPLDQRSRPAHLL